MFTGAAEPTLLRRASLALLLACASLFVAKVVRVPLWSWDHFAIWGVKARRLLGEGGLELGFLAWPELAPSRVDHPLGLPLTWLVLTLGRPPEPADFKALHLLMGRVGEIAAFCLRELAAWDWHLFWAALAAGSLLAVVRGRRRAAALAAAVWLQVAIYGATALFSYLDAIPHLQAAFFRISSALVPLGLVALAEVWGPGRASRPSFNPCASPTPAPRRPPAAGSD